MPSPSARSATTCSLYHTVTSTTLPPSSAAAGAVAAAAVWTRGRAIVRGAYSTCTLAGMVRGRLPGQHAGRRAVGVGIQGRAPAPSGRASTIYSKPCSTLAPPPRADPPPASALHDNAAAVPRCSPPGAQASRRRRAAFLCSARIACAGHAPRVSVLMAALRTEPIVGQRSRSSNPDVDVEAFLTWAQRPRQGARALSRHGFMDQSHAGKSPRRWLLVRLNGSERAVSGIPSPPSCSHSIPQAAVISSVRHPSDPPRSRRELQACPEPLFEMPGCSV